MTYLLSATEWAVDDCFMVLEEVLADLPRLDGIIAYSLFMLPTEQSARARIWDRFLSVGKSFHAALEGFCVSAEEDVRRVEDIWLARLILPHCPPTPPGLTR
jgi:sporadic carbohydrate cluster protein (TIGR04323 family)